MELAIQIADCLALLAIVYALYSGRLVGPRGKQGDPGAPGLRGEPGKSFSAPPATVSGSGQMVWLLMNGVRYHRAAIGSPDYEEAKRGENGLSVEVA